MLNKVFLFIISLLLILSPYKMFSQTLPQPSLKYGSPKLMCDNCLSTTSASFQTYDLDGDGNQEMIIAFSKCLYVLNVNGENVTGFPKCYENLYFRNNIAIADIDGDGYKEIITIGEDKQLGMGLLYVWDKSGNIQDGFPVILPMTPTSFHGATVYDISNDGKLEIFISGVYEVFGFDYKGKLLPGWPQRITKGKYLSSPKVTDIDFDGVADIFVGTSVIPPADSIVSFYIYAWDANGSLKNGWPFKRERRYYSNYYMGAIASFPDYKLKMLIIASSRYPPVDVYEVYALDANGGLYPGWPKNLLYPYYWLSGISLFNFNEIDNADLIITGDITGYLYAWDREGNIQPKYPMETDKPPFYGDVVTVPIVYHDIVNKEYVIFCGTSYADSGYLVAMRNDSTHMPWSPLKVYGRIWNTPTFSDLENDGTVEMIFITEPVFKKEVYLYVYEFKNIPFDKQRFPWPMDCANRWNTSEFGFEPTDTVVVAVKTENGLPEKSKLLQNYPNPFNTSTRIRYDVGTNGRVLLSIYNTLGQRIAVLVDANQRVGRYEAIWNAEKYPSGIYYARLELEKYRDVKKLILMK